MKKIIFIFLIALILIPSGQVLAQETFTVDFPSISDPGETDISSFINNIYNTSLAVGGIAAVAVIVYGSIYLTISGASPDKQKEGKDIITAAIWGVMLLFGAYVVLNTINPQLVELNPPRGKTLKVSTSTLIGDYGDKCLDSAPPLQVNACNPDHVVIEGGAEPVCESGYPRCGSGFGPAQNYFGCYENKTESLGEKIGSEIGCDPGGESVCRDGKVVCENVPGSEPKTISVPDCDGPGFQDCSDDWLFSGGGDETVTIQPGGGYTRVLAYPENASSTEARCINFAYIQNSEAQTEKPNVDGLRFCY